MSMQYLQALSEAVGVSGEEDEVRKIVIDAIKDHVDQWHVDAMGSVIAYKNSASKSDFTMLFTAHMDEIGLMVSGFESDGLIRFAKVGGIDDRILPALRVRIGKQGIPGVILWKPIHLGNSQSVVNSNDLRIDIGYSKKESVQGKVKRGDRIVFDSEYSELSETVVRGKAFDDRVGCSLLIDLLQSDAFPVNVVAAFTVQEEIGLRGAKVLNERVKPSAAIALEGTTAHDVPDPMRDPDLDYQVPSGCILGQGPALTIMDRSMIADKGLLDFIRSVGDSDGIPYQLKTVLGGGTDAGSLHTSAGGLPSGVISIPCRYIHSPRALLNRKDYEAALALCKALLKRIDYDQIRGEKA